MNQDKPSHDFLSWSLTDIGLLDLQAFEAPCPAPDTSSYSIVLWHTAHEHQRRQIIINQGYDHTNQQGWALGIEAGALFFSLSVDAHAMTLRLPHPEDTDWHFVAVVIDCEQSIIRLHTSQQMTSAPLPDVPLIFVNHLRIGGYTDPAGGHYNYTFGRDGTGLVDDCRIYRRALSSGEIQAFIPQTKVTALPIAFAVKSLPKAPTTVTFEAIGILDAARIFLWDFGDGQRALGVKVEHFYTYAGDYDVRLTVISNAYTASTISQRLPLEGAANPLKITPVFTNGDAGCACFRIPSLVRTNTGTLLAFAEGRVEVCSDSTRTVLGTITRSEDKGRTWHEPRIAFRNIWQGETYAVQNISPVIDTVHNTGKLIVLYNALEHSEWDLARGIGINRTYCVTSDDDGLTWGEAVDITLSVHRPYNPAYATNYPQAMLSQNQAHDWRIQRPTLGHAIQLQHGRWRGRIVHAGMFSAGEQSVFQSQNYIFYSDDLGETWHIAGILPQSGLNEATLAEMEDGSIFVNSRAYGADDKHIGRRALTRVRFDDTGKLHINLTQYDEALIDPAVQASMLTCTHEGRTVLLFANPAHPNARVNMTVRASLDNGQTWQAHRVIDAGPSAYSDMTCHPDGNITLIYERGNEGGIVSVTFSLMWLLDNTSTNEA